MKVGHVYRVRTTLVSPPKIKIVLYVGAGFFLWFNTEPRKRAAQLAVADGEVPGITRPCYLDCGRVTVFTESEKVAAVEQGRTSDVFIRRVVDEVALRAITMVNLHRQTVIAELSSILRGPQSS